MRFLDYVSINPKISLEKERIYPFVEMGDVSTSFRNPDKVEYKSFDSGVKFADGDTVIARITPCLQNGKRFYCKNIGKGFGSTEYLVFRPKDSSVDNLYLYYFMNTDFIKESMVRSMVGATGRQRVNNDVFSRLDVTFPNIEIQRRIAEILSTYDDLIENNRKQIKLLEEAAQRLYKEWFVDLRFPGHENTKITDGIPEGWSNAAVTDLLEIKYGKDHKALEDGLIPVYGSGGLVRKVNKKLHSGESVLIPRKGSLNNLLLVNGDFWAIDTMFFGVPRKPNVAKYVYLFLSGLDMYAMNIGAAVPSMTVKILEGMRVLYPVEDVLEQFEKMVGPLFLLIELLKKKSESLADARDLLLPKLMSGELEV